MVGYDDIEAFSLLRDGATLAGEVQPSKAFDSQFRPSLATVSQVEHLSVTR